MCYSSFLLIIALAYMTVIISVKSEEGYFVYIDTLEDLETSKFPLNECGNGYYKQSNFVCDGEEIVIPIEEDKPNMSGFWGCATSCKFFFHRNANLRAISIDIEAYHYGINAELHITTVSKFFENVTIMAIFTGSNEWMVHSFLVDPSIARIEIALKKTKDSFPIIDTMTFKIFDPTATTTLSTTTALITTSTEFITPTTTSTRPPIVSTQTPSSTSFSTTTTTTTKPTPAVLQLNDYWDNNYKWIVTLLIVIIILLIATPFTIYILLIRPRKQFNSRPPEYFDIEVKQEETSSTEYSMNLRRATEAGKNLESYHNVDHRSPGLKNNLSFTGEYLFDTSSIPKPQYGHRWAILPRITRRGY